jgi:hypothetical protein
MIELESGHGRNYIFRGLAVRCGAWQRRVGEPIEWLSPAAAIERAQGLWKVLGHTGAVAFSRTGHPATGDFRDATVLRKFGDVPDDLSGL